MLVIDWSDDERVWSDDLDLSDITAEVCDDVESDWQEISEGSLDWLDRSRWGWYDLELCVDLELLEIKDNVLEDRRVLLSFMRLQAPRIA